jgi:hypothetical protein
MTRRRFALHVVLLSAAPHLFAAEPNTEALLKESRLYAGQLLGQVSDALAREYKLSGPLRSVVVCKYVVPELSSAISRRTGMRVTRVSLKVRNPLTGMPDAFESRLLKQFDHRAAKGEVPDKIEHWEVVREDGQRYFRYMKAIPVKDFCLACHGPTASIPATLKAKLQSEYPNDQAVDYRVGQIRGAITIKKPI